MAVECGERVQVFGGAQSRVGSHQVWNEGQSGSDGLAQQRAENVVLGLEIVVERRLPDADGFGDGPGGRARITRGREQLTGGVEDLVTRRGAGPSLRRQARAAGTGDGHGPIVTHVAAEMGIHPFLSHDRNGRHASVTCARFWLRHRHPTPLVNVKTVK
jgi:hypothetical protein